VASPAPPPSTPCVRGRNEPANRSALGERLPRESDATAPSAYPPEAQRTRLGDAGGNEPESQSRAHSEDAGAAEPEPQAAPCYVYDQTNRKSFVSTRFLAHVYGNVCLESPPASLFHRGNGALCSAMHATTNFVLDFDITTAGLEKIERGDK
jgi:hypothetical protein